MKYLFLLGLWVLGWGATPLAQAQTAQRTAFVDTDAILPNMPAYKKAEADLKAYATQLEKQLLVAQNKAQQDYTAVMDSVNQGIMTPAQQKRATARLQQLQIDLQDMAGSAERRLGEREAQLTKPVYEAFNKAVETVAEREGYTYVFDKKIMLYRSAGIDATDAVKSALGIK